MSSKDVNNIYTASAGVSQAKCAIPTITAVQQVRELSLRCDRHTISVAQSGVYSAFDVFILSGAL